MLWWSLVIRIHPWRSNKLIADKAYFGKFKNMFLKFFLSLIFCSNLPVEYFHQVNGCFFKQTRAQILEALVKTNDIGFFPAARPKQRQRMDGLVVIGPKEGGGDHPGSLSLSLSWISPESFICLHLPKQLLTSSALTHPPFHQYGKSPVSCYKSSPQTLICTLVPQTGAISHQLVTRTGFPINNAVQGL